MAKRLKAEDDVEVEVVKGELHELSVGIDGQKVIEAKRLWYSLPSSLVRKTRKLLRKERQ